jgi:hypothetical protein
MPHSYPLHEWRHDGVVHLPEVDEHFDPSPAGFMMNFRVDDPDALLDQLKLAGVEIDPHREDYDYGRFAWIMDRKAIAWSCGNTRLRGAGCHA